MTKADKIRSMSDEELADYFYSIMDCWQCPAYKECTQEDGCANALLAWLKMEHKENSNEL